MYYLSNVKNGNYLSSVTTLTSHSYLTSMNVTVMRCERGIGDRLNHIFYHRVSLTMQYGAVSYKYNVRTTQTQCTYRINTMYEF